MSSRHPVAAAAIAAALALGVAGCTSPNPTPSESAVPSPTSTAASATPSATPTAESPAPSPSASATPSATPSPSSTPRALTAPGDWKAIDPAKAGVSVEDVDTVVGAWKLPNAAVASIVRYKNDVGSSDPDAVFDFYFGGDGSGFTHEAAVTASGQPVLIVRYSPEGGNGGDSQAYFFILTDSKITAAVVSGDAEDIDDAAAQMWTVIKRT